MKFTVEQFLSIYRHGLFPMADAGDDPETYLVDPEMRGQLPILGLTIPKRLERTVRTAPYHVTINTAFTDVIDLCAQAILSRKNTWINGTIRAAFIELYQAGHAHSIEVWAETKTSPFTGEVDQPSGWAGGGVVLENTILTSHPHPNPPPSRGREYHLIGGLYGLALGQIFCGESMFSRARDASKIALVHLCARLYTGGFQVLDTQFTNDHLRQFGVYEIPRASYHDLLTRHADKPSDFIQTGKSSAQILQAYWAARQPEQGQG